MSSRRPVKKSWKQKQKEIDEKKKKEMEKRLEENRAIMHLLNRIKNAVYIITIIVVLGVFFLFYDLIAMIFFIIIGIVVLLLIYWPIGKEIERRKKKTLEV